MKLVDFLNVIDDGKTLVNVCDGTYINDFGLRTVGALYEDTYFYKNVMFKRTVVKVTAEKNPDGTPYICVLCE